MDWTLAIFAGIGSSIGTLAALSALGWLRLPTRRFDAPQQQIAQTQPLSSVSAQPEIRDESRFDPPCEVDTVRMWYGGYL